MITIFIICLSWSVDKFYYEDQLEALDGLTNKADIGMDGLAEMEERFVSFSKKAMTLKEWSDLKTTLTIEEDKNDDISTEIVF